MALSAGTRFGPYEIIAPIAAGGMGEVYRARDSRLNRDVAIKVLRASARVDSERLDRFEQEARAAAALNHPNVVTVYDIGSQDGVPYIVSELLNGRTLRDTIGNRGLSAQTALAYAVQIASGLAEAHDKGIVHRDLKPENVFVTADGRVKIFDFGLAKLAEISPVGVAEGMTATRAALTQPGVVMGTVRYMSPEQARGQALNHRTDIFSFGAILYEMLSGEHAFRGDSAADTMSAILSHDPVKDAHRTPIRPIAVARIVERCLEKNPELRFQSARDLHFALASLSNAESASVDTKASESSVAVLPFANMSADTDQEYFSDGLAEELINALTRLPGLRVAARTSSFCFRGREIDIREIGRQLNVGHVLEGSVRRSGTRLRITAQLINVVNGYHLWSERYDRELADVFEIQDDITRKIVDQLAIKLGGEKESRLFKRGTHNLEAHQLYLQGRYHWERRGQGSLQRAIACFEQAIAKDPSYALAHAGLADAYAVLGTYGYLPPRVAFDKVGRAARQALLLDDELAEAHEALALVHVFFDWDFAAAERELRRAIALNPQWGRVHGVLASVLVYQGRFDEAFAEAARGRELEPLSTVVGFYAAVTFMLGRRFADGLAEADRVLDLAPDFALGFFARGTALSWLGRHAEAIEAAQKSVELSGRHTWFLGHCAAVLARAGRRDAAESIVAELHQKAQQSYVSPMAFATTAMNLGQTDVAFEWLDRAVEDRAAQLPGLAATLSGDAVRHDPRFAEILKKIGLEGVSPARPT